MQLSGDCKGACPPSIIERRRAAAVIQDENKEPPFAEYVFHCKGKPIGDFRKAWGSACKMARLSILSTPAAVKAGGPQ